MDYSIAITLGFLVFAIVMFALGENSIVYYGYDCGRWITSFWCINCSGSF